MAARIRPILIQYFLGTLSQRTVDNLFWPVAAGLAVYLLFPQSFRRLMLLAGGSFLVFVALGVGTVGVALALLWAVLS